MKHEAVKQTLEQLSNTRYQIRETEFWEYWE